MEKPQAICYAGPGDEVIGWICGNEFCLTVYLLDVVGPDAEVMAEYCCNHPCWKCGRRSTQGFVLCAACRKQVNARVHRLRPSQSLAPAKKTKTLTAPEGTIGAIGAPPEVEDTPEKDADSGDEP